MARVQLLFARYAETALAENDPLDFDAVEVHPMRLLDGTLPRARIVIESREELQGAHCEKVPEGCLDEPDFYSVFLHCRKGGVIDVGDFSCIGSAIAYGWELGERYTQLSLKSFLPVYGCDLDRWRDEVLSQSQLARATSKENGLLLNQKVSLLKMSHLLDDQWRLLSLYYHDLSVPKRTRRSIGDQT